MAAIGLFRCQITVSLIIGELLMIHATVVAIMVLALGVTARPLPAFAANGDLVQQTNFAQACGSGIGVGIAFDGKNLWYSCYASSPDLYKADPITGAVLASYTVAGGLGALAWDGNRKKIWAGWARGTGSDGDVRLIDPATGTGAVVFNASAAAFDELDDGLAYDAQDDSLLISRTRPRPSTTTPPPVAAWAASRGRAAAATTVAWPSAASCCSRARTAATTSGWYSAATTPPRSTSPPEPAGCATRTSNVTASRSRRRR